MKTKIVVFDKDGTLLNFDSFWVAITEWAIGDMLARIDAPGVTREEFLAALGVHDGTADIDGALCGGAYSTMGDVLYGVLAERGCSIEREKLFDVAISSFAEGMKRGSVIPDCKDLRGVLQRIKDAGIKIMLVTNDNPSGAHTCLEALGIADMMDRIYADDGVHSSKPDPYYINEICREYGVDASAVVMVGDTGVDMQFARNAGARAIGVAKTARNKEILMQYTDTVVHDVSFVFDELE